MKTIHLTALLAAALLAGPALAAPKAPVEKGSAPKQAAAEAKPEATRPGKSGLRPGVTTGDDDDINDLEVQRRQKAATPSPRAAKGM